MSKPLAIPLPRGWPRFARSGLVHAVALARVAALDILSGLDNSPLPRARLLAENERLRSALTASDAGAGNAPDTIATRVVDANATRVVTSKHPHHIWQIDFTLLPTIGGLWVPWLPLSLATIWPSVWCVCAVLDHFSRAPVAWRVFPKEPSAADVCAVLDDAVKRAGRALRHIISDKGHQFQSEYREWCKRNDVKPRFGALGKHGSIAVLKRFWRSLKTECVRRLIVPLVRPAMERELAVYMGWYIEHRPREGLGGATPGEVLRGDLPAAGLPPFETRACHPLARGDPGAPVRRRVNGRLELVVTPHEGRAHLPVVELREAA